MRSPKFSTLGSTAGGSASYNTWSVGPVTKGPTKKPLGFRPRSWNTPRSSAQTFTQRTLSSQALNSIIPYTFYFIGLISHLLFSRSQIQESFRIPRNYTMYCKDSAALRGSAASDSFLRLNLFPFTHHLPLLLIRLLRGGVIRGDVDLLRPSLHRV